MRHPRRDTVRRLSLAVCAGAGPLAAFPPFGLWWCAPLGLAALFVACRGVPLWHAALLAFAANLVLFGPLLEWTRYVGVVPWLLLAVLQASVAALLGPAVALAYRAGASRSAGAALLRTLGLVGAVVAAEALRARAPFGGLTWGRLGFSQSDGPLLPWASVGGAPGVGAMVALAAVGLVETTDRLRAAVTGARAGLVRGAVPGLVLVLMPVVAGAWLPVTVDGPRVRVAAVQGNVPGSGLDAFSEDLVVLDNHVRETERLAAAVRAGTEPQPDLVVWPENAADQDPRSEPETRARVDRAVAALGGQDLLLGAVLRDGPGSSSNGLITWGPSGPGPDIYRKRHLVPFGEYLPLRSFVTRAYPRAGQLLARDFTPGQAVGTLRLSGVQLAVGTCFEVAFDDLPREAVRAGGRLLVLPSNNASYGRSAQSAQQLAMARLRAVEHSRSTVVATTSGISALIMPDGRVVVRSALYEPAVLTGSLPLRGTLTLATRYGALVEAALAGLVLLPLGLSLRCALRGRRQEGRAGCAPAG